MKNSKFIFSILVLTISNIGFSKEVKGVVKNKIEQPLDAAYIYNLNSKVIHTLLKMACLL
ncbi:hypothetical protein GSB9_02628 [Flavobacteriaceae bacterium GSB9]|nr:hypothetical protein GSB9_02628 [Flavobacteriaceae bacterium GSB9]